MTKNGAAEQTALEDKETDVATPQTPATAGARVRAESSSTRQTTMPDARETVVVAAQVATGRAPDASEGNPSNAANGTAAKNGIAGAKSPAGLTNLSPWNLIEQLGLGGGRPVDIMKSLSRLEPQMAQTEREIDRLITTPVKLIADIAQHTLGAGGKRLRPALVIAAAQLCGDDPTHADARVTTCAAAVELIHTTSLIHDDVVDSASVRRGKPAANLVWGNETSVLVGDYLFAQVFVTVAQKGFNDLLEPIANATSQLCAGELLETQSRGLLSMKEQQYCDIIALKTAALTECACRLGAMAMAATEEQIEHLARYGREIGMAFQIVDDVFDIVATESRLGKPVGNDVREGDITLPMLRAAQTMSEGQREEFASLLGKEPITDAEVKRALDLVRGTDAVEHCYRMAADYVTSARDQLAIFPDGPAKDMLFDIADYVISRDR